MASAKGTPDRAALDREGATNRSRSSVGSELLAYSGCPRARKTAATWSRLSQKEHEMSRRPPIEVAAIFRTQGYLGVSESKAVFLVEEMEQAKRKCRMRRFRVKALPQGQRIYAGGHRSS
jgi:hypothetical protein